MATYTRHYGETHTLEGSATRAGKTWSVNVNIGDSFLCIWDEQWHTVTGFEPLDNDIRVHVADGYSHLSEISEVK